MQSLDIISVNIWSVLISLANLLILFLVIKKFLYKPVKDTLAKRQAEIDKQYDAAAEAEASAMQNKADWESRMETAKETADSMIKDAADTAKRRGETIISEAETRADSIVRQAQAQAELERRSAEEDIRREIVDISTQLAGKILEREVKADDHRNLIGSFLENIGDAND